MQRPISAPPAAVACFQLGYIFHLVVHMWKALGATQEHLSCTLLDAHQNQLCKDDKIPVRIRAYHKSRMTEKNVQYHVAAKVASFLLIKLPWEPDEEEETLTSFL